MANAFDQFDQPAKNPFDQFDEPESPLPPHVMAAATTYANDPTQATLAQQDHEGILEKFGEGFREGWGPERLGFSDQSLDWLRKKGIFSGLEDKANPFQAFNETIGVAAANGLDALTRFPQAVYRAVQSAGTEAGLPRDVVSIPDAFMGSPHPTGIPKPFVRPVEIKPIEGATPIQRTIAAKTGDPLIDAILEHPTIKNSIDNPVVDDSHSVPNSWGGSDPPQNPTLYRDKDFPKQMTVEAAIPPGMTRLYRGETAGASDAPVPDYVRDSPEFQATVAATGRWFTASKSEAEHYAKVHGAGNKVTFVDVPTADVDKYLSANQPEAKRFSAEGREKEEYFLPSEIAAGRQGLKSVTFDTAEPAAVHENVEQFVMDRLTAPNLLPVPEGHVRFFHGGPPEGGDPPSSGGSRWTSPDLEYARNYRAREGRPGQVWYVDIPKGDATEVAARAWDELDVGTNMEGRYNSIEVPEKWAKQMKPVSTGFDRATALKVAFWEFGEKAEDAWYTAHGMDPVKVEAALKPYVDAIAARKIEPSPLDRLRPAYDEAVKAQGGISSIYISDLIAKSSLAKERVHEIIREAARNGDVVLARSNRLQGDLQPEVISSALRVPGEEPYHMVRFREAKADVPPDLFKGTYPDGDPAKAAPGPIDKPTPEEVERGRTILAQSMAEEVSKNAVSLNEARGLGVIGPEKGPVTTGTPAEKAAKAIPAEGVKDEKVTQEVGTAKDAWRQRFDESVGKLKTGEDIKQLIKDAADAQDDFPAARAGDVPLQHVEQIADAAGVDPASINARGLGRQFKNDTEVRLAYQAMISLTERVKEAARNHKTEPTEQSRIALQEALMRRDLAVEQVVGFRAEWGRVGNTIQEFMERVKNQEQLGDFLNEQGRGRTPKDLDKIADTIDAMDRAGGNVPGFLNDARKPGFMDKLFWYWQNQLISGWLTHTKYAAANATYLAWNRGVITPIARMMDVRSLSDVGHIPLEALSGIAGSISATPMAFMTALRSVKTGLRVPLEGETELARLATEKGEPPPKLAAKPFTPNQRPIAGTLGRIIGAPGDAANAIHTFFRIIGYEGEMQAQAYRAAQLEGHNPLTAQFWDRQQQIRANATEDMMQQGIDVANKGTFIQESGKVAKAFQRVTREVPGLRWIFPFTHIPLNLMKATVESTPFAVLSAESRAELMGERGVQVQHTAIARMVAGSALMGWFVNKALNGEATGDYPNDPKDRDLWKLQGKQPNSILINDKWVSFNKFGPIGDLAGIGATLGQAIPHLKSEDDDEMTKATAYLAQAAGRIVTDEVGMMSLQMMFEAQKDDKALKTFIASWTSSFMPASSLLGQTASFMDPDMRQAKTIVDSLKYRIPVSRETLLPKRDWSGQPVPNPQYGNLLRQTAAQADPIDLEMARLGIHPAPPQDRIGGVKLPPNLYDKYHALSAPLTRQMLGGLVNSEGWNDLPPGVREEVIHRTIAAARKATASALQGSYAGTDNDIIKQGIENKVNKITGAKPTKLQDVPLP